MKETVFLVLGLALSLVFVRFLIAEENGDCRKPNPNTFLCRSVPSDSVVSCGSVPIDWCEDYKEYEILNFPDGSVPSDRGTTSQVQANCWRAADCEKVIQGIGFVCEVSSSTSPWASGALTQQTQYEPPAIEPDCSQGPGG